MYRLQEQQVLALDRMCKSQEAQDITAIDIFILKGRTKHIEGKIVYVIREVFCTDQLIGWINQGFEVVVFRLRWPTNYNKGQKYFIQIDWCVRNDRLLEKTVIELFISSHWIFPVDTTEHVFQFRILAGYSWLKTVTYHYKHRVHGRLNPLANGHCQSIIFQYYIYIYIYFYLGRTIVYVKP